MTMVLDGRSRPQAHCRLRSATLLCMLALGGCAGAPVVRPPNIALPQAYDTAPPSGGAQQLDQWWLHYHDRQLSTLIDDALDGGFSVREALARLEEARAIRSSVRARLGPQGDLAASSEIRRTRYLSNGNLDLPGLPAGTSLTNLFAPATNKTASVDVSVGWEIDLFGRRRANRSVADADLAASQFSYEGAKSALVADVARGLFEARGLAAQLDDAVASVTIQRNLSRLVGIRARRGIGAAGDNDRADADLAGLEAKIIDIRGALDASKRALLVLAGRGSAVASSLEITGNPVAVPATPDTLPGDLLVRRPDVREAASRMQSATGSVRVAELAFYPTITPQATLGYASQTGGLATTTLFGALGSALSMPIFDRARLKAELRGAGARAEQSVLAYERSVQTAWSEADQAMIRLAADRSRMTVLAGGSTKAKAAYDAARLRYDHGLTDLDALLDAERAYRTSRMSETASRTDALLRSVQLFQALGGGWSPSDPPNPVKIRSPS